MVSLQWCLCPDSHHLLDCWPDGLSCLDAGSSFSHKAMVEVSNPPDALDAPVSGKCQSDQGGLLKSDVLDADGSETVS